MRGGWKSTRLRDVCSLDKAKHDGSALPYVGMEHIEGGGAGRFVEEPAPTEVKSATFRFTPDHLLYGRLRPYLNKLIAPDFEGHCSTEIFPIRCSSAIDRRYLFYWLSAEPTVAEINRTCTGARMPRANMNVVLDFEIPLPPLAEQKRIVAILDEAFEAIERAEEATQAAVAPLTHLVERERNAHLRGCVGTADARLGDHIDLIAGPAFKSAGYTDDASGIRLLRGDNIVPGATRWDGLKRWPADDTDAYDRYWLQTDDVVIAMDRPWISTGFKCAMLTGNDVPSLLVQRVARLRCRDSLWPRFLYHLISSTSFIEQMVGGQTGTGVPHISGKQIEAFLFTCPAIEQQRDIAERLDGIIDSVQDAVDLRHRKLAMLQSLRSSLLRAAFSGELEQARGATSELAEVLA